MDGWMGGWVDEEIDRLVGVVKQLRNTILRYIWGIQYHSYLENMRPHTW